MEDNIFAPATSDKEAVDILTKMLMPDGWYSVNPLPRCQIVTEQIAYIELHYKKAYTKHKRKYGRCYGTPTRFDRFKQMIKGE